MEFTIADYVVIAIILVSMLMSFVRGFSHDFLSLLSWVIAGVVTFRFAHLLRKPYIDPLITVEWLANLVAYGGLFIVSLIVMTLISNVLVDLMSNSSIGPLDRSLGLMFGALRGAFFVVLIYLVVLVMVLPEQIPTWIRDARTRPLLETGVITLARIIPFDKLPFNIDNIESTLKEKLINSDIFSTIKNVRKNNPGSGANNKGYDSGARKEINRVFQNLNQSKDDR